MKKIIGIMAVGLLLLGFAGQGMAIQNFATGDLIRVVYAPGSTDEYATDLGTLTSLEAAAVAAGGTPALVNGSAFGSYDNSFSTENVTYYVYGGGGSADLAQLSTLTAPAEAKGLSSLTGSLLLMNTQYQTAANRVETTPLYTSGTAQTAAHSYITLMDGGTALAYPGTYSNFFTFDSEQSLSGLGSGGQVAMYLYNFNTAQGWTSTNPVNGALVTDSNNNGATFEVITTSSGTEVVEIPQVSSVPVPPSLLLLAPGLFGLIGLRRRVGK
jgi:hypothetical protein